MRLRRNGSPASLRGEREPRAFRFELRMLNDGPPFVWGFVTAAALALMLCGVAGSVLSLWAAYFGVAQVLIGVGFLASFVTVAAVIVGGAAGDLLSGLARLARIGDDDGSSRRTIPRLVAGMTVVSLAVTAVICISSLDRMGAGSPEAVDGRYFLVNHDDRTEVSRSTYNAARAADGRMLAVIACVFLGFSAVAAGNRRNVLVRRT
jgi:hypothetical protein